MRSAIISRLVPVLLFSALGAFGVVHAQKKAEQGQATPDERFYREGGRRTKAEVISKDRELTTGDIAQGRDLSLYDDGRHFNCYFIVEGVEPKCSIPKVRQFIWRHWREKRRGYIRVTRGGIDYVGTDHIFIEPNAEGVWHIAWRHVGCGFGSYCQVIDYPETVSVRRVKHEDDDEEGGSYVFSFTDKEGNDVRRF